MKKIIACIMSVLCLAALAAPAVQAQERVFPAAQEFFPKGKAMPWYYVPLTEIFFVYWGTMTGNVFSDSVLVLHKGELIYERYARGWDKDTTHQMYSVTKSVLSALVGVAIQDEKLTGVDQKVYTFFDDVEIPPGQESKYDITIEHLLNQSSGLPGDSDKETDQYTWWEAEDTGKAAFEIPQYCAPGERHSYSSGPGMQTLAGLLRRAVGEDLLTYARRKLFTPLGMTSVEWDAAPDGLRYGGFGMSMTPRDMMRLGYLYLHNGNWDGQQIIPAWYVAATPPPSPLNKDYGYAFWYFTRNLPKYNSGYSASGSFGQFICVLPDQDVVMVRTGSPGPIASGMNRAAYRSSAMEYVFLHWILPLLPFRGVPLDYLRGLL